jgi:hypothetical protein
MRHDENRLGVERNWQRGRRGLGRGGDWRTKQEKMAGTLRKCLHNGILCNAHRTMIDPDPNQSEYTPERTNKEMRQRKASVYRKAIRNAPDEFDIKEEGIFLLIKINQAKISW